MNTLTTGEFWYLLLCAMALTVTIACTATTLDQIKKLETCVPQAQALAACIEGQVAKPTPNTQ